MKRATIFAPLAVGLVICLVVFAPPGGRAQLSAEDLAAATVANEEVFGQGGPKVVITTSKGDFTVELAPDAAPTTVENFLTYVADGHYDRTIFHRVVSGFVVQGGGYSIYYRERPTRDTIAYEGDNGLSNLRGTLAMARRQDKDSAAAQWYVNLKANTRLDHLENDLGPRPGYTVFGRVIDGMDVVDAIGAVETGVGGPFPSDAPIEQVVIERVTLITEDDADADG